MGYENGFQFTVECDKQIIKAPEIFEIVQKRAMDRIARKSRYTLKPLQILKT
jgi:hypothetical protein